MAIKHPYRCMQRSLKKLFIRESPLRRGGRGGGGGFDCNICLESAENAVVTTCGHLFCRRCLLQWLRRSSAAAQCCPVCRRKVAPSNIIKIYGGGDDDEPQMVETTQEVIKEFLQDNMVGKRFVMPDYSKIEALIERAPRQHRRQIMRVFLRDYARKRGRRTGSDSFLQIGLDSLRRSLDRTSRLCEEEEKFSINNNKTGDSGFVSALIHFESH